MDLVEKEEIKRRSAVAAELARRISLERNKRWVGWVGEVLVDEKGKVDGSWVGRNFAYKPVAVKSTENLLGKTVKVKVEAAAGTYLKGTISEGIEQNNNEFTFLWQDQESTRHGCVLRVKKIIS